MAESTAGLFGKMLGIGPLMQALNDPEFQSVARNFLYFIADTHRRVCEIEDMLRHERGFTSTIPPQYRPNGAGGFAAASGASDNGTGEPPREAGDPQPHARANGTFS
jgi:hypothetical protein